MSETKQSVWVLHESVNGPGRWSGDLAIFSGLPSKETLMKYVRNESEQEVVASKLLECGNGSYDDIYKVEEDPDEWEDSVHLTLWERLLLSP